MKSNQKKKPRQRNRPRNKANRLKLLVEDNQIKEPIKVKENFFETFLVNVKEEDDVQEENINYDDMPELIDENDILQENLENQIIEESLRNEGRNDDSENGQKKLLLLEDSLLQKEIVDHRQNDLKEKEIESKKNVERVGHMKQLVNYTDGSVRNEITPDSVKKLRPEKCKVQRDNLTKTKECDEKILERPFFGPNNSETIHLNKKFSYVKGDGDNKLESQNKGEKSKNGNILNEENQLKRTLNKAVIEGEEKKKKSIQQEESLKKHNSNQTINPNESNMNENESFKNRIEEAEKETADGSYGNDLPQLIDVRFENIDIEENFKKTGKVHPTNENISQRKEQDERKEICAIIDQPILFNRNQGKTKNDLNKLELKEQQQQQQNSKEFKIGTITRGDKCEEEKQTEGINKQKAKESALHKLTLEGATTNALALRDTTSKNYNLEIVDFNKKQPDLRQDNVKSVKNSRDKLHKTENINEKNAFIQNLQHQMEAMMAKGNDELPTTLMENLQKLFNQTPVSDIETSDEEDEYIEYIYKPRKYFLISLCNFCKADLSHGHEVMPCSRCHLTYYCSKDHMKKDSDHRQLCYAIKNLSDNNGGRHIFYKCCDFTPEQFRSYRIVTIKQLEKYVNRPLTPSEQEIILFPRLCVNNQCREYRFEKLKNCQKCGMIAYCKGKGEHHCQVAESAVEHQNWCEAYQLFKQFVIHQEKFGRLEPSMPSKVLKEFPVLCTKTKDILKKLNLDLPEADCEYAALTQISTVPLTAWYALKVCDKLKDQKILTIHLIGAEIEFEVDLLHKWELFFLHITPTLQQLNVIFIGPELDPKNISFDQLSKTKCCRLCRNSERSVTYRFITKIYHDYCRMEQFLKPNLICFFNAGLYRSSGYNMEDTWPATICAASQLNVPVVVSAYTEYEMPLDMQRFVQESSRRLNVILPPHLNPFKSMKPERNFISDDMSPLMFKNYYCFVIE